MNAIKRFIMDFEQKVIEQYNGEPGALRGARPVL